MAKTGRGNKAIETLSPTLRAAIDDLIDAGKDAKEIYDEYPAVQSAMALRTLTQYVQHYRARRKLRRAASTLHFLEALVDKLELARPGLSAADRMALGTVASIMLTGGKATAKIRAGELLAQVMKGWREQQAHEVKMKIADKALAAGEAKAGAEGEAKKPTLEEVAAIVDQVIRAA